MTEMITVRPDTAGAGGERYVIRTRGHQILVDQPERDGGTDAAPTPTELFVAGLVSCVAFYAGRYLTRHGVDRSGLAVTAEWAMATGRPARVGRVDIRLTPPAELPPERIPALLAVASHCTVHNSLGTPPDVSIELAAPPDVPIGLATPADVSIELAAPADVPIRLAAPAAAADGGAQVGAGGAGGPGGGAR